MTLQIDSAAAMETLGNDFAQVCRPSTVIYLQGELGSGKTTLARGFLHGLGHIGKVKSPTYTLVESYDLANCMVYHFDLYRLTDPEELDYLGVRDYLEHQVICLIEWAARGQGYIPSPDIEICLDYQSVGRSVNFVARSAQGDSILDQYFKLLSSLHS